MFRPVHWRKLRIVRFMMQQGIALMCILWRGNRVNNRIYVAIPAVPLVPPEQANLPQKHEQTTMVLMRLLWMLTPSLRLS